jgi:hypothetical protein
MVETIVTVTVEVLREKCLPGNDWPQLMPGQEVAIGIDVHSTGFSRK